MTPRVRISRAAFARLWADPRLTSAEIGRLLGGISVSSVGSRATCFGLPPRPRGRLGPQAHHPDFLRMWQAGVRPDDMARHFGVGESTIHKTARRLGLTRRISRHNSIRLDEWQQMELARAMARAAAETRADHAAAAASSRRRPHDPRGSQGRHGGAQSGGAGHLRRLRPEP